jgi:TonB family protein
MSSRLRQPQISTTAFKEELTSLAADEAFGGPSAITRSLLRLLQLPHRRVTSSYRVQPIYPPLARQARIQGTVQLRAIISKTGTIENLVAVSGHPMLVPAALNAVRQWRYRPFLLNSAPIDVETEITVNFVLSEN